MTILIGDVRFLRDAQFAEDASPMAHPVRPASYMKIDNFYTLTGRAFHQFPFLITLGGRCTSDRETTHVIPA